MGATDPGHGINPAPDNSNIVPEPTPYPDGQTPGGASYYFGLENYQSNSPDTAPFHYLSYDELTAYNPALPTNQNAQYGMTLSYQQQVLTAYNAGTYQTPPIMTANPTLAADTLMGENLSNTTTNSNPDQGNTNVAGGAQGELITNSFSLQGYSANDLPTLYFDYLLGAGWNESAMSGVDIAKVSVSVDGGAWQVVASNQASDMARYQSVFSNTGSSNANQGNQFLWNAPLVDTSNPNGPIVDTWRQARIDLEKFAGAGSVRLMFSYSAPAGTVNNYHGFAIDDIVVGLADRGEMVTQDPSTLATPPGATNPVPAVTTFFPLPQDPVLTDPKQSLVGPYELEIRHGQQYANILAGYSPDIAIVQSDLLNQDARSVQQYTLLAPGAMALGLSLTAFPNYGDSFTISDGLGNSRTFEWDSSPNPTTLGESDLLGLNVAGNIPISVNTALTSATLVQDLDNAFLQAINGQTSSTFNVTARFDPTGTQIYLTPTKSTAKISVNTANAPALTWAPRSTRPARTIRSRCLTASTPGFSSSRPPAHCPPATPTCRCRSMAPRAAIPAARCKSPRPFCGRSTARRGLRLACRPRSRGGPAAARPPMASLPATKSTSSRQVVNTGGSALSAIKYDASGDSNPVRPQGEVLIEDNNIRNATNFGIMVQPAKRDATDAQQQSAAVLTQVNNSINQVSTAFGPVGLGLAPGIVIENNIIDSPGTGGILYSGDSNVDSTGNPLPNAIVAFGRIVNNTIYGTGSGVGIGVTTNASPTLLNNILANLQVGIAVDPTSTSSTVLGANLYQNNTANVQGTALGTFDHVDAASDPLFINAAKHNFNLQEKNSAGVVNYAIDSSLQVLADRSAMTKIEAPLGIGPSPIIAPSTDETGKLRVADHRVPPNNATGSNVFIDRGALDVSDFIGPSAALANPPDNGAGDQNPAPYAVLYGGAPLPNFQIQLNDGNGSGVEYRQRSLRRASC